MHGRLLVFLGAGVGVPLELPTATDFSNAILEGKQPITADIIRYLGDLGGDIEWILSTLETFSSDVAFTEFILNRVTSDNQAQVKLRGLKHTAAAEIVRIKKIIFNKLTRYEVLVASNLYFNLLKQLREHLGARAVSVITTNYDLALESAIERLSDRLGAVGLEAVDYGFSIRFGRAIYDSANDFAWSPKILEVRKLHGSLDWHRDMEGNCTRAGSVITPDDPGEMPILYPGYKAIPDTEPFASLHGRLHKRLTESERVIVVGFAFRDAYINSIFDNVLRSRSDLKVDCFNPIGLDKCPKDSKLPYFVRTYANFRHIGAGISLADEPLPLDGK